MQIPRVAGTQHVPWPRRLHHHAAWCAPQQSVPLPRVALTRTSRAAHKGAAPPYDHTVSPD
ncbi:hypothetical protein A7D17_00680 [Xanthomonas floridensis]|uniref:Uncharacterized protein n=1 Tax=Xanthomonas floridensis TaxID=1843580 RepID=A0A1A9MH36_9XANT|nr:hypothetical protein A7D17_00680 [Xanthomonas floridensis]